MARSYAAIMALVAMLVVFARAIRNHSGLEETIVVASAWMALFGAIGFILGTIARSTVDHSVQQTIESELAALAPRAQDESGEATPGLPSTT